MRNEDDFGVRDRHERIGREISDERFKGKVLESLKNIGKKQEDLRKDLKEHLKESAVKFEKLDGFNNRLVGAGSIVTLAVGGLVAKIMNWWK